MLKTVAAVIAVAAKQSTVETWDTPKTIVDGESLKAKQPLCGLGTAMSRVTIKVAAEEAVVEGALAVEEAVADLTWEAVTVAVVVAAADALAHAVENFEESLLGLAAVQAVSATHLADADAAAEVVVVVDS